MSLWTRLYARKSQSFLLSQIARYWFWSEISIWMLSAVILRGGADKSLARPGRKQTTATKHGIYSTYSPRSSIHFLACCSNFCKLLKKFRRLSVQPGLLSSNELRVGRNVTTIQLVFSPGNRWWSDGTRFRRIWWVLKTLEAQTGQFLLGWKCQVSRGIVVQEQDPLGDFPAAFFLQKSFNFTSRDDWYSALIVWPFGR